MSNQTTTCSRGGYFLGLMAKSASGMVAHMVFAFARVGRRASLSGRQALDCGVGACSKPGNILATISNYVMKKQGSFLIFIFIVIIVGCNRTTERTYYANGKIEQVIRYKNGVKDGRFESFYENGQLKVKGNYKDGLQHGVFTWYYETGILQSEGTYINGLFEGLVKIYYSSGELEREVFYINNKDHGEYKSYYRNGQLKLFAIRENGNSTIYYEKYDTNGVLIEKYRDITIENLSPKIYIGDTFKARISVRGPISNRKLEIVTFLIGVDKHTSYFLNESEIIYESIPINREGSHPFIVNIYIDTVSYMRDYTVEVFKKEEI